MGAGLVNWLFLKGLARGQVHWDRQPKVFEAHVPGSRVHTIDLPGIGEAHGLQAPWRMAEIVEDIRGRFQELRQGPDLDATQPWSILGISLGGMIAMEWITSHPREFENAVIITSSAGNVSPPWKRLLPSVGPHYIRAALTKDLVERGRRALTVTINNEERRDELVQSYLELAGECPMPFKVIQRQLVAATGWRAPKALPIPTLFLGSHADGMVHPSCTPALAARFAAPFRMHESAGHEIPHEDPSWIADQVAEWLVARA
jgi:pimeloyl-[acyl-carrier protein] methyl ester esterase